MQDRRDFLNTLFKAGVALGVGGLSDPFKYSLTTQADDGRSIRQGVSKQAHRVARYATRDDYPLVTSHTRTTETRKIDTSLIKDRDGFDKKEFEKDTFLYERIETGLAVEDTSYTIGVYNAKDERLPDALALTEKHGDDKIVEGYDGGLDGNIDEAIMSGGKQGYKAFHWKRSEMDRGTQGVQNEEFFQDWYEKTLDDMISLYES